MENQLIGGEGRDQNVEAEVARRPGPDGIFSTTVNDIPVKFSDAQQKGERILDKASFKPADDFVLIQLMRRGTRSIGLDEVVDLSAAGTEAFRAFKSDRIFRFTLNEHGFEWGASTISEAELHAIGHVGAEEAIILDRDGHEVEIKPGEVLDLGEAGTEHLHTEKRLITVFFENKPREIPRGIYSTEQLKTLFSVQEGYVLEVINEEGILTELKPGQHLRVKNAMRFFEQVPCGGSS
jgi:hypothetical protein